MKTLFSSSWVHRTSWLMILIQILSPVSLAVSSVVHAAKIDHAESTLAGMQAVIDGKPIQDVNHLPALGSENNNASGEKSSNNDSAERVVAGGASRAGQLLSSDDSTRATINYAKGIAESLINNEINDWLNQKGNGRISIGSDKTVSGDVLVPLSESDNSLLFTQGGLRTKEDRNTVNLGVGYRQYAGDWMYGVNSFYDYDYTGKNARLGVGTEAWTNYLKLAANGYFGLTDWHQSKISSMRDYDERPANGFDLRAEAWLPSWPQLGGKLKYEQYFGKGIDLGTGSVSPDKLKDNPKALTAGLTYTPFPLISFSGERSIGDRNQTRVGMDLNYRFGVPLHQQLNSDSVDMMRSLAGNRYELVDRNYDIVMQYRKQELLRISLPETVNAQAADTLRIPVTVHKAKYGLKDTEWTPSAEFVANGGSLRKVSATEVEVKVPAYAWNTRTGQAQEYTLKAVGTDANGNRSNTASTIIRVAPSRNVISSLTVSPDTAVPADNAQFATLTATVTDEAGQPLAAQELTFSVTGLTDAQGASVATLFTDSASDGKQLTVTTDARGQALVMVRSKIAKDGTVTVKMDNGNFKSAQVRFVADAASAQVSALKVTKDNAIADGVSANELVATVQDVNGNPLENFTVGADVDNDGIVDTSGVTDSNGNTTLKVMNARAGATNVTVRAGSGVRTVQTATVNFVVDKSVAEISEGDLTVGSGAVANGTDSNAVTIKVTDGRGNAVAGATLQLSTAEGANLSMTKLESGADGTAHTSITSLRAGTYEVKVTILESGKTAQAQTAFIADESTAEITDANLTINPDGAVADGVAKNGVVAVVTDAQGNLVSGVAVSFTVESGASITTVTGTTGADGKATAEVTSTTAGTYTVTATVNGKATQKNTIFVADGATAEITDANLTIVPDNSPANGTAKNGVVAVVTDAQGNLVPGAAVSFTVEAGASITTVTGTTGADGKATAEVTSTTAGTYLVTATVNGKSTQKNTTFVADLATANITDANLSISPDGSVANGHETNGVEAVVTDVNGNVVAGAEVSFSMSSDKASVTTLIGTTGADGKATATVTSTTAGTYVVTAKVNGTETHKNTTFVADSTTAEIKDANLTIDPDGAVADGATKNSVAAVVSDAHGNLVSGAVVSFSVESGATITTVNGTTGADGKATADITSTTAGTYAVTATVNSKSVQKNTTFVADTGTAEIVAANMTVEPDGAAANGTDKNTVKVSVTDAQGNVVPDTEVSFNVAGSAAITPASGKTDANGKVSADITSIVAGTYKVSASVNGKTQVKHTTFVADSATAEITDANLTIDPDNSPANGTAKNGVTAIVTDAQGNLVPDATVSFTVEDGASITTVTGTTGADGKATAEVTSTTAGTYTVTVTVNGKATSRNTTFVPDSATAEITDANLTIAPDNSPANGTAKNGVVAVVTDAQGNLVPGAAVSFTVEDGASITTVTGTTGADGKATAEVTSITAGTYLVTATVNGKATSRNTTFVADGTTAEITDANLTIDPDNSPANGTAKNGVVAVVTDAQGNPVPDATVSFIVEDGASITTVTGTTGADGRAKAEVTSTTAGTYTVTATVNGNATSRSTTFVADGTTAEITDANLVIDPDGAAADGVAKNGVTATVTDAQGNLVPGAAVSFTVEDGASITTVTGITGADGKATAEVTSTAAGIYTVTATVNGKTTQKNTTFVADVTTAEITDANLVIVRDNSPAGLSVRNRATATVTDAYGNLVSGVPVNFEVESGAKIHIIIGITVDGIASAEISSYKAGTYVVTATVNGKATQQNTTFVADSTTAEITDANLVIDPDYSPANGTAKNGVTATVTDYWGNLVPGAAVSFTVEDGASITTVIGTTGADGKATAEVISTAAGTYLVTATVNGKATSRNTTFVADGSTAEITDANLTIDPDNAPANGVAKNGVTAIVTDTQGNLVPGAAVSFTVEDGATITIVTGTTGADGKATAEVTATVAGIYAVTATVNGKATQKNTTFVADGATAEITDANLTINPDGAVADGVAKNGVTAIVTDAQGNLVPDATVSFTVEDGATITTVTGTTGADGRATAEVSATAAGTYLVTATVNGKATQKNTTFVADGTTAEITDANLTIAPDNSPANGTAKNGVVAVVTDAQGNLVPGAAVSFTVENGASITTVTGTTGADGRATAEVTSTTAGTYTVTATVNGKATSRNTTFVADGTTAEITDANLTIDPDSSPANGTAKNGVTAIVTDVNGNVVPGASVAFTVSEGAVIATVIGTTGADGKATAEVTSLTAGSYTVTATVNGKDTAKDTTFTADGATAEITEANLSINPDNAPANGTDKNGVTAVVTDANGNVVPGASVAFTVSEGAVITTVIGTTGADGKATAEVTATAAGTYLVTATVNGKATSRNTTFVADGTTAEITDANLTIDPDSSPANGTAKNGVTAIVTDVNGNVVSDASVAFTVSEGAVIATVIGTTGADGKATAEVTSLTAGSYTVTATVNGKDTAKDTTFTADGATAEITEANLTINPNNAPANGTDKNGVTAIVTDANGNVVPGAVVSFAVTDGATINVVIGTTGEDGKATAEVTSTIAGTYTVTATVNGKETSKDTTFIADKNTAEITDANLTIAPDGAVADGSAKNGVTAVVTDANGNLVSDAIVMFTVTEGAAITTITGTTGADGKAVAEVTSTTAGTYTVTASVNNTNTSANTRFVADKTTARIELVQLGEQSSHVVGSRANFTATAMDANGNLIQDADFDVKATGSDSVQADILNISSGIATLFISDTQAGTVNLAVNLKEDASVKANSDVVFAADTTTAEITEANLTINPNNAIADGVAKNGVTATVTDNFGNLVENADVAFSVADGAVISVITGTTGEDGKATAEITSTTAGTYTVTAKVNGKETEKDTTFVADGDSAHIADADLSIDPDKSVANGAAKNGVTAIVTDSNGNVVPGASVAFTVSEGAEITTVIGTTGEDGKATAEVISLTAGTYTVTATVNGKETAKDTTFVADRTTAEITDANLVIDPDGAVADGSAKNGVTAVVTDANGNLVPSMDVTFAVTEGATITTVIGTTGADGKATAEVTSLKADAYIVTASVNGKDTQSTTRFVADKATAHIVLERQNDKDSYVVGELVNYTATMLDANDNVLVDEMLNAQGLNSADGIVIGGEASGKGRITFTATTTKAGTPTVWAGQRDVLNGNDIAATDNPTFVADKETAQIIDANINVYRNGSPADGKDTNYVGVVVTDAYGNVVSGIEVDAAVSEGATIVRLSNEGVTSPAGVLDIVVSSLKADTYKVTATVNGKEASADIYFVADVSTAMVTDENLTIEPDGAVADGKEKNGARAVVTDANGNIVEGVAVTFSVTGDAEIQTVQGVSDENGLATAEITSLKSGTYEVRAVAAGSANFARQNTHFIADHSTARMVLTAVNPLDAHPAGSKANFTASVQDANGNVFKDAEIELSATGTETTEAEITGVSNGVASLYVTDTKVGDVSFTVKQKGNESVNAAETVKFIADVASARIMESDFDTPKANAIANGEDEIEITASVTDQYGNPIPVGSSKPENGVRLTIDLTGRDVSSIISNAVYSDNRIVYTLTMNSNTGTFSVHPMINGTPVSYLDSKNVEFIPVLQSLRVNNNNQPADGVSPITLLVRLGNGLGDNALGYSGKVGFTATNGAAMSSDEITTSATVGYGSVDVRSLNPGTSTVTATFEKAGIIQQLTVDVEFVNAATILDNDLIINPDNAVANGADKNVVTAIVTDGHGTPAAGEEVTFSVESGPELTVISGTSDADGKAIAELASTVAGSFKVTASVNGNAVSKNATFVADASTAAIELTRTDVQETYVAGTRIGYVAVAKDANGNTITDAEFEVKAEGGTAASASITSTNNGVAVLSLYDTRAGETKLTVSLANNADVAADDTVTYVPDESSSKISNMAVVKDWALAAFLEENIVTFDATDRFGNKITNVDTSAFEVRIAPPTGGSADWKLSQIESGSFEVRIKGDISNNDYLVVVAYGNVAGASERVRVWFAGLLAPLSVEKNDAPANGQSKNVITGRMYHGVDGPDGSSGPGKIKLNFRADNGAILTAAPGYEIFSGSGSTKDTITIWSDSNGYARVEVTNITPGLTTITMTELSHGTSQSQSTKINFEPVVELKDGNVVIDPDNAPADGVSKNVVTATVTNQNGSPVAGAEVSFEVEAGPVISVVNGTTGGDGKAVAELTSLQKGVFNITVKVNDSEVTKPVTFISDAVIKAENMIVDPDGSPSTSLDRNRVTAIVTDNAGNPLSGETVEFTVEEGPTLYPIITTTGGDGKAVAELESWKFGTFNVTATVNGKSTTKPTTFVQWGIGLGAVYIVKDGAIADNRDTNEMKVWVTDGNVNPIEGEVVTFEAQFESSHTTSLVTFEEDSVTTDENGEAIIRFTARAPGKYKIIASNGGIAGLKTFTFVTSGIDEGKSSLDIVPSTIVANNSDTATIAFKARDMFDNAITGLSGLEFLIERDDGTALAEDDIVLSAITEGDPVHLEYIGRYTATIRGATPGRYKITPAVEGNRVGLSELIELTSIRTGLNN